MDFFDILKEITVSCKDDGEVFTDTERIEKIDDLLWNGRYRRANYKGLYYLYATKPLKEISQPILISSHIDTVMRRFFTQDAGENLIRGTYDNSITNAAILYLMLEGKLPDNVIVAFTGDEEEDSTGANDLMEDLSDLMLEPVITVVLDVTDMAWDTGADFTVENNFWDDDTGEKIINAVKDKFQNWRFVPSDEDDIPEYVDGQYVIDKEAEADESWDYDEQDWECFSLCLPINGDMHGNEGVYARKSACVKYIEALEHIIYTVAGS